MASPGDYRPPRPGLEVTPEEADRLVRDGAPMIDVRESRELELAAIDGATHIPLGEIEARLDEIEDLSSDEQPVLVLCHHGLRSLRATLALHALGIPEARSVAGGIDRWSLVADANVSRYVQ